MEDEKNDKNSKGTTGASCLLEIAIIVLTALTFAKNIDTITDPLSTIKSEPIPIENTLPIAMKAQGNYLKQGFLHKNKQFPLEKTESNVDIAIPSINSLNDETGCTKEQRDIYVKIKDSNYVQTIKEILNKNKTLNLVSLILSAVAVGSAIVFGCCCGVCCVACLNSMKESNMICCLMCQFMLLVISALAFSMAMLICSVTAMKKIKSELPPLGLCSSKTEDNNKIMIFNEYRAGFYGRDVAVVVLSSILFAFCGIMFLCVLCMACCAAGSN